MKIIQRITPFLSYVDKAEEAADFYVSIVRDSKIVRKVLNPSNQSILTVEFELCEGISQTQIDLKKGMTFASGLGSVLRL